jgi:hypothetical protein
MTPSDELFNLIKSLTPSEKRYFKIWASRHVIGKSNNYEKLYDAIDVLPDDKPYDEAAFKKSLRGKSYGKNLSDEKANLREILLKAMRVYNSEKTIEGKLYEMMQDIRFMLSKTLLEQGKALAKKAYAIAEERELLEEQLMLINYMRQSNPTAYDKKRIQEEREWSAIEADVMRRLSCFQEVNIICDELTYLFATRQLNEEDEGTAKMLARLREIEKMPGITFLTLQMIITLYITVYGVKGMYDKCIELDNKLMTAWENSPDWRVQEEPLQYMLVLKNALVHLLRAERLEEMLPVMEKMRQIPASELKVQSLLFQEYWNHKILYLLNTNKYKEAMTILPDMRKGLREYGKVLSFKTRINIMGNIVLVLLKNEAYSELLIESAELTKVIQKNQEYNYQLREIKFWEFIAYFELGEYDKMENHIRASQRFFKDSGLNNLFIEMLWKQLRTLGQTEYAKRKEQRLKIKEQLAEASCPESCLVLRLIISDWLSLGS